MDVVQSFFLENKQNEASIAIIFEDIFMIFRRIIYQTTLSMSSLFQKSEQSMSIEILEKEKNLLVTFTFSGNR